jgi:chemotaxis protein histidine kinase CheA
MAKQVQSRALASALIAVALAGLNGCANLMTINRATDLPGGGRALHLDAPQRVAYASNLGTLCAEPSPDALQAYASSLGVSISSPTEGSAAIANSLAASAGSFGLRTQSITLMRDHLYRICEAYYNGKINHGDVISLMQRSQDLTLGILAIEQLTGAVVARQVVLTPGAESGSGSGRRNDADAVAAAQKDEEGKKAALATATAAQTKQKEAVAPAAADVATRKSAAAPAQATIDALKPLIASGQRAANKANNAVGAATGKQIKQKAALDATTKALEAAKAKQDTNEVNRLTAQQKADQTQLEKDDAALAAATKAQGEETTRLEELRAQSKKAADDATMGDYSKATANLKAQQDALKKNDEAVKAAGEAYARAQGTTLQRKAEQNATTASASGRTSSGGAFSSDDYRNNVNKDTVAQVAAATQSIVETVVYKGRLTEACANMITAYARDPSLAPGMKELMPICKKIFDAAIKGYLISLGAGKPIQPLFRPEERETLPAPAPAPTLTPPTRRPYYPLK